MHRRTARSPHWMLNQLPVGMLDNDFFVRFVSLFQELGTSLLENADNIENAIDPSVAPETMVRWMASWIGVDAIDPLLSPDLQRVILRGSSTTMSRRGTKAGLLDFLQMTSGGPAEVTESGGVWQEGQAPRGPATVTMKVDSTGWLPESDFIELLSDEIPAHVRAELWVGDRQVWSSAVETGR